MKIQRFLTVATLATMVSACSSQGEFSLCHMDYPEPEQVVVAAPAPAPPPAKPDPCKDVVTLYGVNFDFDKSAIRPDAEPILQDVADALGRCPAQKVRIEGHTDATGPDTYNAGLSNRRAEAVRLWLIGAGIGADVLEAEGFGESRPVDTNETKEGRARNRRVELHPVR